MREIGNQAASRRLLRTRDRANAIKRSERKMLPQQIAANNAVKICPWPYDGTGQICEPVGHHQLAGGKPRQLCLKRATGHRDQFKIACRNISGGYPKKLPDLRNCNEHVGRPAIEQTILSQSPCGHKPHNVARDQCLSTTRLGLVRAFRLLGNRDAMPRLNQPRQIPFGGMDRHPAHGNWLAIMFPARRQSDVQRRCRRACIIKEEFEKISHAVEQQAIAGLCLQTKILHHHGCRCVVPRHEQCVSEARRAGQCLPLRQQSVRA